MRKETNQEFRETVAEGANLALLERNGSGWEMHRLIADLVRDGWMRRLARRRRSGW